MSFRKPFQAVPIQEGREYRRKRLRAERRTLLTGLIVFGLVAAVIGGTVGYLIAADGNGRSRASVFLSRSENVIESVRTSDVLPLHFQNCDEARAAGKAPIYRGHPGYSLELDADNDGIACEPYT